MIEKEEYNKECKLVNSLIRDKEKEIDKLKNDVYGLEKYKDNLCKHKMNDGSSAIERESYWVSDIKEGVDSWTGEIEYTDYGYTDYYEKCKICGKEFE